MNHRQFIKRSKIMFQHPFSHISMINGIKLFENPNLTKSIQFRFPRCKSKRIRRKWAKRSKNLKDIPDITTFYKTPWGIIGHPILIEKLKRHLDVKS